MFAKKENATQECVMLGYFKMATFHVCLFSPSMSMMHLDDWQRRFLSFFPSSVQISPDSSKASIQLLNLSSRRPWYSTNPSSNWHPGVSISKYETSSTAKIEQEQNAFKPISNLLSSRWCHNCHCVTDRTLWSKSICEACGTATQIPKIETKHLHGVVYKKVGGIGTGGWRFNQITLHLAADFRMGLSLQVFHWKLEEQLSTQLLELIGNQNQKNGKIGWSLIPIPPLFLLELN